MKQSTNRTDKRARSFQCSKAAICVLLVILMVFSTGTAVFADGEPSDATEQPKVQLTANDKENISAEGWELWGSGNQTINFKLNYVDAVATVGRPGEWQTGYFTNANQFSVKIKMNEKDYVYTFSNGSAQSSGVFFAIEGNGSASPYMLRPNQPKTGKDVNPNEVSSDYQYYAKGNKVKETTKVELKTGEIIEFCQVVEFRNDGVFHRTYMTNAGTADIEKFRIINKVDTFLDDDNVPVYYGEMQDTYYIKHGSDATKKLRVSGLEGITGSYSQHHERIWESGFINRYRYYDPIKIAKTGESGINAYTGEDSEIVYDQEPYTLKVGDTAKTSFAVNFLEGKTVTVRYVDEQGIEIAESEFIKGDLDAPYTAKRKDITGYTLDETKLPLNETGTIQQNETEVLFVYNKAKYTVTYDANGGTGSVEQENNAYLPKDEVTALNKGTMSNGDLAFAGWNTVADGTGTSVKPGDLFYMPEYNVVLYAQWEDVESTTEPTKKDPPPAPGETTDNTKVVDLSGDGGEATVGSQTQTGDESNMLLWGGLMLLAALTAAFTAIPTLRRRLKK